MNLKDFFRSKKQPHCEPAGGFWALVCWLCQSHVEKTVADFRRKGWPLLDWAEPRYRALITPEALDWLIREARHLLTENLGRSISTSSATFRTASWMVKVSVFPSAEDNEFLSACPGKSYEQLALQIRASFREQVVDWANLDFAHWVLLIDNSQPDAAVNLHTIWSLRQCIRWTSTPAPDQPRTLTAAPSIVPVDLIRSNPAALIDQILRDDARCDLEQEDRNNKLLAGQVAKILLMDSITAEVPLPVSNPIDVPSSAGSQSRSVLDEACRKHAEECRQLSVDVPLVFGVPQRHLRACQEHLAAAAYHGLNPKNVSWVVEVESALFGMKEGKMIAQEDTGQFLAGGGNTFLMSIAGRLWFDLWSQGVRWVLVGQLWNLGCRVNTKWLKAIATCEKDGLVECTSRDMLPDSKLILLNKGSAQPKLLCVDDHRLRTGQFQKVRTSAPVGTGSVWIKLERLFFSLGLDSQRALNRFDQDYLNHSFERLLKREPIIMFHSAGGLAASLPFWEILSSLDLRAVGVSPERFNPRVEPIAQR